MNSDADAAVLLLTMKCNIRCAHCSVDSHPQRSEHLQLDQALALADELCALPWLQYIDITGGEPLLRRHDVVAVAQRAKMHGKSVRVVSNGYWARSEERAYQILLELTDAGVSSVGLSIDEWHLEFLDPAIVQHYIAAARAIGMAPLLSCVVRAPLGPDPALDVATSILALLERYGLDRGVCLEVHRWAEHRARLDGPALAAFDKEVQDRLVLVGWQLLNGEGRGADLVRDSGGEALRTSTPIPCPAAGNLPTFDENGRLFPCCSPWSSRKSHAFERKPDESAGDAIRRMQDDPVVSVIHDLGPLVLIREMETRGVSFPQTHSGICNQCGMLLDRVPMEDLREAALSVLEVTMADQARYTSSCEL